MTRPVSAERQAGGGDRVAHVVQRGPGLSKCQPADVRGTAGREARRQFALMRRSFGSQAAAARELGCSEDSVMRWEAGKASVPGWALVAIRELTTRTGT